MSLNLHPGLKQRLAELLAAALPKIHITHNSFIDWESFPDLSPLDAALPGPKTDLQKALVAYVGDLPLRSFISGVLSDDLRRRPFEMDGPKRPLTGIPEYADVSAVTARLIDAVDQLPRSYSVLVSVSNDAASVLGPAVPQDGLDLTPDVRLITVPEGGGPYAAQPKQDVLPFFLNPNGPPNGVTPGTLYLAITGRGYIPTLGSSAPLEFASFMSRAFFGLCIAQVLLSRGRGYRPGGPHRRYLVVYGHSAEPYPFQGAYEFPIDLGEAIDSLAIHSFLADKSQPETLPKWVLGDLADIGAAMTRHDEDDRLLRAAQWLFDSYAATNPLLAFVQATTSLEILLGDKTMSDLVGLGALLGNRCAFLIGKSRSQRDKILTDFQRIYETRSKIVHRGHPRLSPTEENDLWMLHWMCSRVIQEEMKLMLADPKA